MDNFKVVAAVLGRVFFVEATSAMRPVVGFPYRFRHGSRLGEVQIPLGPKIPEK